MVVIGGDEFERPAVTCAEPHGENPAGVALRPQQQLCLGGPPCRRPRVSADVGGIGPDRPFQPGERVGPVGGCRDRRGVRTAARCQLAAPTGVPQMPVQVEPETPGGMWVRMVPRCAGTVLVPECQGHPLAGVRPSRRCPHHQLQRRGARTAITAEGDGQPGPEPPVGSNSRHVPAKQIRCQPTQIRSKTGDELGAVAVAHGAQIEIDVDPSGGAGPRPVTDHTPCGRSLDHGRWYGVLTHALPHQQMGRDVREVVCHQHSPCANDSPDLYEELFFIPDIISTCMWICQSGRCSIDSIEPSIPQQHAHPCPCRKLHPCRLRAVTAGGGTANARPSTPLPPPITDPDQIAPLDVQDANASAESSTSASMWRDLHGCSFRQGVRHERGERGR